jgi:hypothetical protein
VAAKLFLWPLGLWLLATRRLRTTAVAALVTIVGVLAAWAVIGFDGLSTYPRMLSDLSTVEAAAGVSLVSVGKAIGISRTVSELASLAAAAALLAATWRIASSGAEQGDRRALGLAVIAGLLASPLVWPHYLSLVIVPIALLSPRLSPLWFVPLLAWLAPIELTGGSLANMLPYLAIEAIVGAALLRRVR